MRSWVWVTRRADEAAELEAGGSPRRKQIWRNNSKRLPVVAIRSRRRYWEGCNVAAAARRDVLCHVSH